MGWKYLFASDDNLFLGAAEETNVFKKECKWLLMIIYAKARFVEWILDRHWEVAKKLLQLNSALTFSNIMMKFIKRKSFNDDANDTYKTLYVYTGLGEVAA